MKDIAVVPTDDTRTRRLPYARTEEFIALYDEPAFDATYDTLPMPEFEPILRRVMAQPVRGVYANLIQAE